MKDENTDETLFTNGLARRGRKNQFIVNKRTRGRPLKLYMERQISTYA